MTASTLCVLRTGLRLAPIAGSHRAPNIEDRLNRIRAAVLHGAGKSALGASERARDRELLARVSRGEVAALRTLYEEHAPRAMAIAIRILRSVQDAEDVVQETFVELWRRSRQFDAARGGAVAWVVTIARSRAIDRLRASGTAGRAIQEAEANEELRPAAFPLPHLETERRRDEARVARALRALPVEQRRAIELAYFDGLSQSEIAQKTGSPLGTVKMRVKLAIAKLAALLKEDEG
jgi:RNA polymerase sigma-70 factor (ECF subfamily)